MFSFLNTSVGDLHDRITLADCLMATLALFAVACFIAAAVSWINRKKPGHW